jgi:glyoxylase-like metal-dependent hydrolase (beta-lactamase superfamily II)
MEVSRFPIEMPGVPAGSVNAYVVGESPGLLVDPGGWTPALDDAVAARDVDAIAVTHTHPDHVGALAEYAEETDATVHARRWHADRFRGATGVTPDATLGEGDAVEVGTDDGDTVSVGAVETPGHAVDHLAFETPAGTLCGDLAVREGSLAVTVPGGDMRAYLTALRRLHARDPPALFPGHGPVIDDPRATLERLIRHRKRREERVVAAVENGASRLETVVDGAYEKDLTGVRSMARGTVQAHLRKLDAEGRLRWDERGGEATPAE